jgi:hypothetical protein
MATRWKIRSKLSLVWDKTTEWAGAFIVGGMILSGLYRCAFEPKPEPEACGPHRHIHAVREHRTGYDVDEDLACLDDHRWACMQAASKVSDKELAALGCPSEDVLWQGL